MFKKKEKILQYELKSQKETIFLVRTGKVGVELESAGHDWSVSYAAGTYEAGMVNALLADKSFELLMELARIQYMCRLVFMDVKLIKEFYQCIERSVKRAEKSAKLKTVSQPDAEILAEERVLTEQSEESINELEKIKKNGTKKK